MSMTVKQKEKQMEQLKNAREIMTGYFKKQGFSRVPSDYAHEFLRNHFNDKSRDCTMIRTSLMRALTAIAYEIMHNEINEDFINKL